MSNPMFLIPGAVTLALVVSLQAVDRSRNAVRTWVAYLYYAAVALYLTWRIWTTCAPPWGADLVFPALSLLVELVVLISTLRLMNVLSVTIDRSPEADRNLSWWRPDPPPRVAILIPTYNEPPELVERCIVGARNQQHPAVEVWVLDDGARAPIRELAARYGARYLARSERSHGKAGNLNHACQEMSREGAAYDFIAVLDSDYVALPAFVSRVLALMYDARTGLVQTPQNFYNPDNFQRALPAARHFPGALRFGYDVRMPARDAREAVQCSGTSFLIRVRALQAIGGFPTESVTEDLLTSIKLRQAGWRTVYLNELLSFGVATEGLGEYLVQRRRWGLGFTQMAWIQWRLARGSKSLWQRLSAFETALRLAYTPVFLCLLLALPLGHLWFGWRPWRAPDEQALAFALPVFVLYRGFVFWVGRGRHLPVVTDAVSIIGTAALVRSMIQGTWKGLHQRFVVTDKARGHDRAVIHWSTLIWTGGLAAAVAGGLGLAAWRDGAAVGAALCLWSLYSLAVFGLAALFCFESPRQRAEERYPAAGEDARLRLGASVRPAVLVDLNSAGVALRLGAGEPRPDVGSEVSLELQDVGWIAARVVRNEGEASLALCFLPDPAQRELLISKVYSLRYVHPVFEGRLLDIGRAVAERLLGPIRPRPAR